MNDIWARSPQAKEADSYDAVVRFGIHMRHTGQWTEGLLMGYLLDPDRWRHERLAWYFQYRQQRSPACHEDDSEW